jgi:hypothetical protein
LKIPKDTYKAEHHRGIYFSPLYTNTNEFLKGDIDEKSLVKSFDTSYSYLNGLWKEKYAAKRIKGLIENNRTNKDTLFYDDLIFMSWEDTREKYLQQVGR